MEKGAMTIDKGYSLWKQMNDALSFNDGNIIVLVHDPVNKEVIAYYKHATRLVSLFPFLKIGKANNRRCVSFHTNELSDVVNGLWSQNIAVLVKKHVEPRTSEG
jgi:hypothetical protein